MASWRDLQRHPLSSEYKDITGPAWYRFTLKMKKGFLAGFPILLYEGMVLDGWQRLRGCIELDLEPSFATFQDEETGLSAQEYVETVNDERRHETPADVEERNARRERVAEARTEGKSIRVIAEDEEISTATVQRDLESSHCDPPVTVTGKDGRQQPAKKPKKPIPRCDRCKRFWTDSDQSRPGCVACHEARKAAKKPEEEPYVQETNEVPPAPIVDDFGTPIPDKLLPVFRAVELFKKAQRALTSLARLYKAIEACPAREAKPVDPSKQHYEKFSTVFKNARWRITNMVPSLVCACSGDGCPDCRDKGWLTFEETKSRGIPA